MDFHMQSEGANSAISSCSRFISRAYEKPRILIVCDDDPITKRLELALREAGFDSEVARNMTLGCSLARSGRFQVVFTVPILRDGSWQRLADIAGQYDLGFLVILVASNYGFNQCDEAVKAGAFDVLDPVHELPKTGEAARCALWAAYLNGAGPSPDLAKHPRAA